MAIPITMPRLSDTMQEGTLIKWSVKVGDKVKAGAHLADVETDKATMELQAFDDGVVAQLAVKEGQVAPVGKLILVLAEKNESIEEAIKSVSLSPPSSPAPGSSAGGTKPVTSQTIAPGSLPAFESESNTATAVAEPPPSTGGGRIRISPLARKLADEMRIDVSRLQGTGPGGRIIKRDLTTGGTGATTKEAQPQGAGASPGKLESKTIALSSMRKTIARRLVESKTTIPHFTVTTMVDMDALLGPSGIKKQLTELGVELSVNDFIVRAAALALLRHPEVNASWAGESIQQHGAIHIGIAVALPAEKGGGLVVPVIRDADQKSLAEIRAATKQLAEKARSTGLSPQEMSDGTFTISNLGMYGVEHFEAIINPPQAAILAVGAALEKPVVRGGKVVPGWEMALTLSGDHRVVDGATGAAYLKTLKHILENPVAMLM